jgi:hypothetical protein
MCFGFKRNRRVEIMEASIKEATKEASVEDMDKEEEEDVMVVEEDNLPSFTMARKATCHDSILSFMYFVGISTTQIMSRRIAWTSCQNGKRRRGTKIW